MSENAPSGARSHMEPIEDYGRGIHMAFSRRISGRFLVVTTSAFFLFGCTTIICDGEEDILLHVSPTQASQILELRYLGFDGSVLGSEKLNEHAIVATRTGSDFECSVQYAFKEYGGALRVDTVPPPKELIIWIHHGDDSWSRQVIPTPPRNAQGIRETTVNISKPQVRTPQSLGG
jgi:hypothetical protein